MSVLLGLVVGLLCVRLLVTTTHELLRAPTLERENHRGRSVPTAMGVLAVLAVVIVEAGRSLFGAFGVGNSPADTAHVVVVLACVGFGLLGLFDDLAGSQSEHGFRGHLGALTHGKVTTGAVKIVAGLALGVVLVTASRTAHVGSECRRGRVARLLAANLSNLFDRAPRTRSRIGLPRRYRSRSSPAPTASASRSRPSSARSPVCSATTCTNG